MTTTRERLRTLGIDLPRAWELPEGVRRTFQAVRVHGGGGVSSLAFNVRTIVEATVAV